MKQADPWNVATDTLEVKCVNLGLFAWLVTFVSSWAYCVGKAGYLVGLDFGWMPSFFLASAVFFVIRFGLHRLLAALFG
jgi:hypothetical protein